MDPGAVLLALLGQPNLVAPALGLRRSTTDRPGEHGRGPRARRRGAAGQGHDQGRSSPRPTATRRRRRWIRGWARRCAVAEATRNVVDHRRPAAGRHQLPQLRRSRPARGVLAAAGGRPRPGRRLPGAGPAGHRRQRQPLQRVAGRARSRRPPRSASSACSTTSTRWSGRRSRGRATWSCWSARRRRAWPARAYAALAGLAAEDDAARAGPRPRGGAPGASPRGRRARAASRSAQDVSGGGLAVALAECAIWGGLGAPICARASPARRPSSCSARAQRARGDLPATARGRRSSCWLASRPAGRAPRHGRRRPAASSSWPARARPAPPRSAARGVADALDVAARGPAPRLGRTACRGRSAERRGARRRCAACLCGVVAVRRGEPPRRRRVAALGLFALQHRGQESAGLAVSDGEQLMVYKDLGLVAQVLDERRLPSLRGHLAIAHCRYSTTGSTVWENTQPTFRLGPAAGRSRSATTATSSTPASCSTSCRAAAAACRPRPTRSC